MTDSVARPGVVLRGLALLAALATVACVRRLPPAPTPEARVPAVDTRAPLAAGHGRLVIDVVDGPTLLDRVRMVATQVAPTAEQARGSVVFSEAAEPLCQSPCVTDVPLGNLVLSFPVLGNPGAREIELVHVGPEAAVYRRSLSVYRVKKKGARYVLGIIATALGGAAVTTGVVLLPIGLDKDNDGLTTAGAISLGAGAVVLAWGIWAVRRDATTYRPGSALHFSLP